jgi:hypothetical protein
MRANPGLDIATAITELAVGEALVSLLDEKGRPGVTERVYVLPPGSQIGPITPAQRQAADRQLAGGRRLREDGGPRIGPREAQGPRRAPRGTASKGSASQPAESGGGWLGDLLQGSGRKDSVLETVAKSAARTIGSSVGREIIRGVLGSLLGGSRRR